MNGISDRIITVVGQTRQAVGRNGDSVMVFIHYHPLPKILGSPPLRVADGW